MMDCPDVEALIESPQSSSIAEHCRSCPTCDSIAALVELRASNMPDDEVCARAEIAIAQAVQQGDTQLAAVSAHIEQCAQCCETAVRVQAFGSIDAEVTGLVNVPMSAPIRTRRKLWPLVAAAATLLSGLALGAALVEWRSKPEDSLIGRELDDMDPLGDLAPPGSATTELVPSPLPPQTSAPVTAPSGVVAPNTKMGSLSVSCIPECDDVVINGKNLGPGPIIRHPVRGFVQVALRSGKYVDAFRVFIKPGINYAKKVRMGQVQAAKPERGGVGFFTLVCSPTCDSVFVDERSLGPSPIVRAELPVGSHSVRLRRGSISKHISVTIVQGQTSARRVSMND
jgi:hypothetical protein